MSELLWPRTDVGVGAQLLVLAVVGVLGIATTRRHPERRLVGVAGIALRALH